MWISKFSEYQINGYTRTDLMFYTRGEIATGQRDDNVPGRRVMTRTHSALRPDGAGGVGGERKSFFNYILFLLTVTMV